MATRTLCLQIAVILLLAGCAWPEQCAGDRCKADRALSAAVQARLDRNAALAVNGIYVQTIDDTIYLHGIADTAFEIALAESIARDTPGVTLLVNDITLRHTPW